MIIKCFHGGVGVISNGTSVMDSKFELISLDFFQTVNFGKIK